MHVCMLLLTGKPFPPDIRVEKEIKALIQKGIKISILVERTPEDAPELEELYNGRVDIIRLNIKKSNNVMRFLSRLLFWYPSWSKELERFFKKVSPNVLHVHDLTLVPTGLAVAKKFNIPVIADLHENLPAAERAYRVDYSFLKKCVFSICSNYYVMRYFESKALKKCAKIIVVVPEASERLKEYGIDDEKIVLVSNTEDETTFKNPESPYDKKVMEDYDGRWIASYIGGIGPHRGVDTVLNSIPLLISDIPNFLFLLVGADPIQLARLNRKVKDLNIEKYVSILGWRPFYEVNSLIAASNVCLVPHNDFEHTQTTIPHKLFQYMICRKPVLVSDCRPLKRVVGETGAGVVFKANNSRDFAEKLYLMYSNPSKCAEMGRSGHDAALTKYSWKLDAERLIGMYKNLFPLSNNDLPEIKGR